MTAIVQSECVFGSAARGTEDALSDKDVLIVADDQNRMRQLVRKWEDTGWSIAAYSPSRLLALTRKGSLFVQHIKREGIIITDNGGWLANLLNDATPKQSYKEDFRLSSQMLKPLERLDFGYWSQLMAADLGFVYIRNAGIYKFAEVGVYEFGYDRIVNGLADAVGLTPAEVKILEQLRALKVAYRLRDKSLVELIDRSALLDICAKVAQCNVTLKISEDAPIRLFPIRYATLRDFEARMIMQFDVGTLDRGELNEELSSLWKMVTTPREYSCAIRKIDQEWVTNANRVLAREAPRRRIAANTYQFSHESMSVDSQHKALTQT